MAIPVIKDLDMRLFPETVPVDCNSLAAVGLFARLDEEYKMAGQMPVETAFFWLMGPQTPGELSDADVTRWASAFVDVTGADFEKWTDAIADWMGSLDEMANEFAFLKQHPNREKAMACEQQAAKNTLEGMLRGLRLIRTHGNAEELDPIIEFCETTAKILQLKLLSPYMMLNNVSQAEYHMTLPKGTAPDDNDTAIFMLYGGYDAPGGGLMDADGHPVVDAEQVQDTDKGVLVGLDGRKLKQWERDAAARRRHGKG